MLTGVQHRRWTRNSSALMQRCFISLKSEWFGVSWLPELTPFSKTDRNDRQTGATLSFLPHRPILTHPSRPAPRFRKRLARTGKFGRHRLHLLPTPRTPRQNPLFVSRKRRMSLPAQDHAKTPRSARQPQPHRTTGLAQPLDDTALAGQSRAGYAPGSARESRERRGRVHQLPERI